jgi:hypothetical protein
MKKNMGLVDRIVRVAIAVVIIGLYYAKLINGTTATVLGGLALIFVATSFISFCPLYWPFGLSTRRKTHRA